MDENSSMSLYNKFDLNKCAGCPLTAEEIYDEKSKFWDRVKLVKLFLGLKNKNVTKSGFCPYVKHAIGLSKSDPKDLYKSICNYRNRDSARTCRWKSNDLCKAVKK